MTDIVDLDKARAKRTIREEAPIARNSHGLSMSRVFLIATGFGVCGWGVIIGGVSAAMTGDFGKVANVLTVGGGVAGFMGVTGASDAIPDAGTMACRAFKKFAFGTKHNAEVVELRPHGPDDDGAGPDDGGNNLGRNGVEVRERRRTSGHRRRDF